MGNDYEGQEKGIEAVKELPSSGKEYLSHHLRNSLQRLVLFAQGQESIITELKHIEHDLNRAKL